MISVIVPIYNVEKYLPKCLDSLAAQTFSDVEFILIDDGSTDKSGEIADGYISDSRFRIFHTENNGLSAARNYGIDKSIGEWLMFVDGDDWVDPDFCKKPYGAAFDHDSDLVIFQAYSVKHGRWKVQEYTGKPVGIVSQSEAIEYSGSAVWKRLYKKKLFDIIRFPEGMVCEDIATTPLLVYAAKRVCIIPDYLYYYVNRKGSITHTYTYKFKRDSYYAFCIRRDFLKEHFYPEEKIGNGVLASAIGLLASRCPHDDPYYQEAKLIVDSTKMIPNDLSCKMKSMLILWKTSKPLFYLACIVTGRMRG